MAVTKLGKRPKLEALAVVGPGCRQLWHSDSEGRPQTGQVRKGVGRELRFVPVEPEPPTCAHPSPYVEAQKGLGPTVFIESLDSGGGAFVGNGFEFRAMLCIDSR